MRVTLSENCGAERRFRGNYPRNSFNYARQMARVGNKRNVKIFLGTPIQMERVDEVVELDEVLLLPDLSPGPSFFKISQCREPVTRHSRPIVVPLSIECCGRRAACCNVESRLGII